MSAADRRIAACIPYYGCRTYIRRAVECLLAQSHRDITVVVVNDGDPEPPWRLLAGIRDSRLLCFDLSANCGPYLATAVVLSATSAPYLLIQDADDWSTPGRAECLLNRLENDGSDYAVSAQIHYSEASARSRYTGILRWSSLSMNGAGGSPFVIRPMLTPEFVFRAPHHGLFRTAAVRNVGGYYAGFRVSYDAMLTNLILMTGSISHVSQPLYYRLVRPGSLTQAKDTGMKSRFRRETEDVIAALYRRCYNRYSDYLAGRTDSAYLVSAIRRLVSSSIPAERMRHLEMETARLKRQLLHTGAG